MTVKPLVPNPVEPTNFSQALDALLTLGVCLQQQGLVDADECETIMDNVRDLSLAVLDHGEELYQQSSLNAFYRDMNLPAADLFVDSLESARANRRELILELLAWADELCLRYLGREPLKQWHTSNAGVDEACRHAYLWTATGHDPAGPELLRYSFAPSA